jgi:hypothetical protein
MTTGKFLAVALSLAPAVLAQTDESTYIRDLCIKGNDGKHADLANYLRDVTAKLAESRVKAGDYIGFVAEQAMYPAGSAAACDYHLVYAYHGFPKQGAPPTDASYKQANVSMTLSEATARRDACSRLVSAEIFRIRANAGANVRAGGIVRRNYYRMKEGQSISNWLKLETTGWKPYAEAISKIKDGTGWVAGQLVMPGGDRTHYQGMTVDFYPNWDSLGQSVPADTWQKVHPELSFSDYMGKVGATATRYSVETYRVVHQVWPTTSAGAGAATTR